MGLPLIGNGDVFSPTEWQQRLATPADDGDEGGCGVTTAMIGRAALIKPWIFTGEGQQRWGHGSWVWAQHACLITAVGAHHLVHTCT